MSSSSLLRTKLSNDSSQHNVPALSPLSEHRIVPDVAPTIVALFSALTAEAAAAPPTACTTKQATSYGGLNKTLISLKCGGTNKCAKKYSICTTSVTPRLGLRIILTCLRPQTTKLWSKVTDDLAKDNKIGCNQWSRCYNSADDPTLTRLTVIQTISDRGH